MCARARACNAVSGSYLLANERIDQGGFARIRKADQGHLANQHMIRTCTSESRCVVEINGLYNDARHLYGHHGIYQTLGTHARQPLVEPKRGWMIMAGGAVARRPTVYRSIEGSKDTTQRTQRTDFDELWAVGLIRDVQHAVKVVRQEACIILSIRVYRTSAASVRASQSAGNT